MTTPYLAAPPLRTRIAPSPRGFIHIGWYRNIIFSWLLARRYGGQLLLRIEDTDIQRVIPGAVENLMEGLAWLGINPDEGPYYQSQRCNIYTKYAYQMLSSG